MLFINTGIATYIYRIISVPFIFIDTIRAFLINYLIYEFCTKYIGNATCCRSSYCGSIYIYIGPVRFRELSLNIGEGGLERNTAKYPQKLIARNLKSPPPLKIQEKMKYPLLMKVDFLVKNIFRILFVEK